ncbi:heme lyase CcmF/NrfE family subunit [Nostoc sp. CHAB 5834]|nr:heme lyase CcmF/NrfE family subunit [Nostoc sp. CHAB 5834]
MSAEIGCLALILAFVLSLVQSGVGLWGATRGEASLMALTWMAATLQAVFVSLAFAALAWAYVTLDFSVALVAQHSHSTQPLPYRIAATWGSHEGSLVLWILILALHGGALVLFGGTLRATFRSRVLAVQGMLGAAFLGFSLFTSNPFERLMPAALEGTELNPLLQDPGLITHPPLLYLGYVGFSMAFAFAVAALIEGRVDAAWARWVRPWVLLAWTSLTLGIALGSHWAYYELGWGGWWFWDPVENASLMPWLLGTALLHSALVLEKRGALISWTLLLAILTFSLSLIGTFLVRSGVLTSVHAFAVDPTRGGYVLAFTVLATGSALALYAWRAPAMRTGALFSPVSREAGMTLNNLFLVAATVTVFLGTFYPVFIDVIGDETISVGPPYYALTFVPLSLPLLAVMGFGPMMNWKRDRITDLVRRLIWPLGLAGVALIGGVIVFGVSEALAALGIALGIWLVAASALVLLRRWKLGARSLAASLTAVRTTPRAVWAAALAHLGIGVLAIGVSAMSAFGQDAVLRMTPGAVTTFAGRTITLDSLQPIVGPNYRADRATFAIAGGAGPRTLTSERRFYPSSQDQTTEAGIGGTILGNLYISVGEGDPGGAVIVRMWYHPFVGWIWGGAVLMALGGAVSLSDRRLRLGAPSRAPSVAAAPLAVPT